MAMTEQAVVSWKHPIHEAGLECCSNEATYRLKKANNANPTKSKQSAIEAEHSRPPLAKAYKLDGK
eukprot:CAMPEP_0170765290 /NCGR_PEP_ID=MMETSP0733-20121128/4519_1 /TAXON_ID=186038 /ORGANISM="Fragilariopsis kerguelensis, Strain L26-C5" /LENGTH=65 /DNA_ID=CAMNT_0011106117 /DNA_START=117 /DNA_END=314 /DNA_ORIENTATION=-